MLSWIVSGIEYQLNDFQYAKMLEHEGFGLPAIRRLEERGPLQQGVTDRGFRYEPRTIILTLAVSGDSLDDYYAKRHVLTDAFKARNRSGRLRFSYGAVVREIRGNAIGDSLQFSGGRDYKTQRAVVAIRCPDPTWYDPTGVSIDFNLGIGGETLEVPMDVPMPVGVSTLDDSQAVVYPGTAETFPTIRITGPIEDCAITHEQTGLKLDFDGVTIPGGEWIEVDTRYGRKTVIDQDGNNRIADLTPDSDLALFSILPDPDMIGGSQSFRVTGLAVDVSTNISLSYLVRYIGV